jgi:hypothetical protein
MMVSDQPFAQTMGAIIFVDEDVAKVGKYGVIADNTPQPDLFFAVINAEDQRVLESAFGAPAWTCVCPVGAPQKITDHINVKTLRICANGEWMAMGFDNLWHGVSVS